MSITPDTPTSATVKPEVVFIEDLLDEVLAGQLRVPRFQRPFVWSPSDMRQLFDSIYKSYPIGSLLIWETSEPLRSLDKIGPFPIGDSQTKPISFVLDGHQRLTTLLSGLRLPADAPRSQDPADWEWWIFFDLEKCEFVHDPAATHDPRLFPLRAMLKTVDFLSQSRSIQNAYPPTKAEGYIRVAETVAQKIKAYKLPVTRIRGGTLSDAVAIFSRLNSLGMGMTADQMISALTYQEGESAVNLAEEIDSTLIELEQFNFGQVLRKHILQVVLIAAGLDLSTGEWETIANSLKSSISDTIQNARRATINAARFLFEKAGVPDGNYLPYANQFVVLAAFFLKCPQPDANQERILLKWFWSTSLSGWFAGANPSQIRNVVAGMRAFAQEQGSEFTLMPTDGKARPLPIEFNSRNARIRCMLIFLLSRDPQPANSMTHMSPEEMHNGSQGLSYVFTGVERRILSHPANRIFLHRLPGVTIREQIMSMQTGDMKKFLESHCINDAAFQALQCGDADRFVKERWQYIQKEESAFYANYGVCCDSSSVTSEAQSDTED